MSNNPCPACHPGPHNNPKEAEQFDGGWLHPSIEFPVLLHCNSCGAYFNRPTGRFPLRRVAESDLPLYQPGRRW